MVGDYNLDFIFCIEATTNMKPIAEVVNNFMKTFVFQALDEMEKSDRTYDQVRIKVILFRDFTCCTEPIVETDFFTCPEQTDDFFQFVDGIEYAGGFGFCNALEAIALALRSDWTTGGTRRRHMIVTISNGKVRPLGGNQRLMSNYPSDIPDSLAQLGSWWEGDARTLGRTYQPRAGRLVAFVPNAEPWTNIQIWDRYWPIFWNKNYSIDRFDVEAIIAFYFVEME